MNENHASFPRHRRDRIFAAAAELFALKGFHNTSIREIAEKSDLNSAMVSYYFLSKENLLIEILKRFEAELKAVENSLYFKYKLWETVQEYIQQITGMYIRLGCSVKIFQHELLFPVSMLSANLVRGLLIKQRQIFRNIFGVCHPLTSKITMAEIDSLYYFATGTLNGYFTGHMQFKAGFALVREISKTKMFVLEELKLRLTNKLECNAQGEFVFP